MIRARRPAFQLRLAAAKEVVQAYLGPTEKPVPPRWM